MAIEAGSSDMDDPLQGYSYLSLFPQTCRSLSVLAKPTELSDLKSVHNVLKTMELKEPGRQMDQAKRVLESSSEEMQPEISVNAAVRDVNDEIARKRRPGLGRKQAKFNFKISQPAVVEEPALDITKLDDPEEFFLAHERFENAKKELRKRSGVFVDMDVGVNDLSSTLTARPRRPGIPGRSKATYKHHCSSVVSNNDFIKESSPNTVKNGHMSPSLSLPPEPLVLSEETSKQNHLSLSSEKVQLGTASPVEDRVLGGSISEVNKFLDKILSGTYDHLSSDGQLTLLQEQLQIKPINIDNLRLPKLPEIPKYDFRISGNFSKPRKSLPDTQAAFTGMGTVPPLKTAVSSTSVHLSTSPTPPRSPFANLSSLKKHIIRLNRSKSKDSFSNFNTDPYSVEGSSSVICASKQPDSVHIPGGSRSEHEVCAHDEDGTAVSPKSPRHEVLQDYRNFPGLVDDISAVAARDSSIQLEKFDSPLAGAPIGPLSRAENDNSSPANELSDMQMQSGNSKQALNSSEHHSCMDAGRSSGAELHETQSDIPSICPAIERVKDVVETSKNNKRKGKSSSRQEHDGCAELRIKQRRKRGVSRKSNGDDTGALGKKSCGDQRRSVEGELHDNQSGSPNNHPEEREQEQAAASIPKASEKKQSKTKDVPNRKQMEHAEEVIHPRKTIKRRELSLRKSIAVAGTSFKSGVRRSTRLKMRPLEFWRGERFLFGRLEPDSTLPSLIGVKKYATPGKKEGKAVLQVVDCVDGDKYRELIDLVALH